MVTKPRSARRPRPRDSEATRERILRSVGRVLARHGFAGFGVNAVAREARVDKVLIYRYFGGLPELLEAFAERADFWPAPDELAATAAGAGAADTAADRGVAALVGLLRALRARSTTQEVLRWELAVASAATAKLAEVRERQGMALLARIAPGADAEDARVDLPALAALLSAGIVHLVLRAKTAPAWLGVPLDSEQGWARIERVVEDVVRRALAPARSGGGAS